MKKLLRSHATYYLSFSLMLLICFGIFVLNANQPQVQLIALMLASVLYVLWGVVHHFIHHDISLIIMVEYVLIAVLVITLGFFVIK